MRATALASAAIVALASQASAETIKIDVGPNGGFAFQPNNIKAKVGDVLSFNFHPLNHSVVMGDFATPCAPAKMGGFYSGFMPVSSGVGSQTFDVTVNNTDPIFFYCAQNKFSHCISGMSGVINGPSSGNTLDTYQSAAKAAKSASNPKTVFGGRFISNAAATSSPTTTSAAAASTTSCTTSNKAPNGNGYKRDACSKAGSVQASIGIVAASLGMALLLS